MFHCLPVVGMCVRVSRARAASGLGGGGASNSDAWPWLLCWRGEVQYDDRRKATNTRVHPAHARLQLALCAGKLEKRCASGSQQGGDAPVAATCDGKQGFQDSECNNMFFNAFTALQALSPAPLAQQEGAGIPGQAKMYYLGTSHDDCMH
jgi:hypothetical protein